MRLNSLLLTLFDIQLDDNINIILQSTYNYYSRAEKTP